MYRGVKKF